MSFPCKPYSVECFSSSSWFSVHFVDSSLFIFVSPEMNLFISSFGHVHIQQIYNWFTSLNWIVLLHLWFYMCLVTCVLLWTMKQFIFMTNLSPYLYFLDMEWNLLISLFGNVSYSADTTVDIASLKWIMLDSCNSDVTMCSLTCVLSSNLYSWCTWNLCLVAEIARQRPVEKELRLFSSLYVLWRLWYQ